MSYRKDTKKLDDLFGDEILVRVSQLVVNASDDNNSEDTCDFLEKQQEENATIQTTNDDSTSSNPYFLLNSIDNFVDDFEFEHRSRSKEDIFHQFKSLPINKSDVLRPTVIRMLIHATFIFDAKDFESIEKILQEEKAFDERDPDYHTKVMAHFYFNKEWWRHRCRMYVAKAENHAARLRNVFDAMKKDPELNVLMTPDLEDYFNSFVTKALCGEFEEPSDVTLFVEVLSARKIFTKK